MDSGIALVVGSIDQAMEQRDRIDFLVTVCDRLAQQS